MTTPNGRFVTQKKFCLSMSDLLPLLAITIHLESRNPMWSVSSILIRLLTFYGKLIVVSRPLLLEEPLSILFGFRAPFNSYMDNSPTTGSVAINQRLAKLSLAFNCINATFQKLFP
ncbi:hypothetical protein EUTSA_v10015054mg [Eutrema salsugineum]|uniref:Uncharacterized protein n=1 Tax=Eutrema salsugineum TaxID=72664 RepID=V4LMA0_EUTSA|nr:hypothetical protein EUTSA_v10015054mg [Eutrema salsugineum]